MNFKFFFFIFSFLCCSFIFPEKAEALSSSKDVVRGIVLVPDQDALLGPDALRGIEGTVAFDVRIPGGIDRLKGDLEKISLDKSYSYSYAQKIKQAISEYFYKHGDPFVIVHIPKQYKHTGVLQFMVVSAKVGKVKVEGNQYSSEEKLKEKIPAKSGERIDLNELDRSLYLLNRNPFRRVDLIYSPGEEDGTTDLTMLVQDHKPWRVYGGFNNSGVSTTDRQRWFLGATLGNLFGQDQVLSLQYMASYNISRFQAISSQYIIPSFWGHQLNLYGGYSQVSTDLDFPSSRSHGKSYQASFRYNVPFYVSLGTIREGFLGGDYKGTNNTVEYSQLFPNFSNIVNLTQVVMGYNETYEKPRYRIDINLELDWSPGQWLDHQTNADYEALRPNAKNHWVIGRGSFKYYQNLPKEFAFYFFGRGQLASQNLLPSEQIGLGGYDTVRGYTERQLNYDSGLLATAEFHSPRFPVVSMSKKKQLNDAIYFLLFFDYGYGHNHNLLPKEPSYDWLLGAGPGIRYNLHPFVQANLDWGFKLHQSELFIGGSSMLYFNITLSY